VVTVPFVASRYQPLCAVYRRTFAAVAEAALAAGKNKIDALFSQVPLRVINDEELSQAGFNAGMFRNVNTPEEWGQAKHELESQAQHL
jgi:molybdopterin-guanine dinucleotide biosynthesis protein A